MRTFRWATLCLTIYVIGMFAVADTTTLDTATPNTTIFASTFNKIVSALEVDFVPRNTSSVPTAEAGSLGTSTYPWSQLYIGPTSAAVSLDENAGSFIIKVGGVSRASVSSTGLSLDSLADGLITYAKLNANAKFTLKKQEFTNNAAAEAWTVPTGVTAIRIEGCGGGGGGGGGGGSSAGGTAGGGAGGQGSPWNSVTVTVVAGEELTIDAADGGTAGAGQTSTNDGEAGTAGGNSTVTGATSGLLVTFHGGGPGGGGESSANGGTGGQVDDQRRAGGAKGGTGGTGATASLDSSNDAKSGEGSVFAAGGAAGTGGAGLGAGGGGGGAGLLAALQGADGTSTAGGTASTPSGRYCAGGGGGSGGRNGNQGGNGAAGASAKVIISWVAP